MNFFQTTYSEHSELGHDGLGLPDCDESLRRSSSGSIGGAGGGSSGLVSWNFLTWVEKSHENAKQSLQ